MLQRSKRTNGRSKHNKSKEPTLLQGKMTPDKNVLVNRLAFSMLKSSRREEQHSGSRLETQGSSSKGQQPFSNRSNLPMLGRSRINQLKEDHANNVRSILEKCATSAKKVKKLTTDDLTTGNPLLTKDVVEKSLAQKEIVLQSLTGERELVLPDPRQRLHSTLQHDSNGSTLSVPVPRLGLSQLEGAAKT